MPFTELEQLVFTLLLGVILQHGHSFMCMDENGDPVDSWVALSTNEDYQYYFHYKDGFEKSPYLTNQTTYGAIMTTVNQLYVTDLDLENVAWALYNDDPPPPGTTASSTYAHSKGVILSNSTHGFWLIHSKPNWPNGREEGKAGFPDTQYSQSLMCVSYTAETINSIATAQMITYPFIYDAYMAPSFNTTDMWQPFMDWISGGKSKETNLTSVFTSLDGVTYTHYGKSKSAVLDLYEDLVAPGLNSDLNVETWRLGSGGRMGSMCLNDTEHVYPYATEFNVYEVASVTMPDGFSWTGTEDHSKWASTVENQGDEAVCIGDENRMCSQENRGGGTACVSAPSLNLWSAFNNAINGNVSSCWVEDPCLGTSTQCYWCDTSVGSGADGRRHTTPTESSATDTEAFTHVHA